MISVFICENWLCIYLPTLSKLNYYGCKRWEKVTVNFGRASNSAEEIIERKKS